MVRFFRHYIPLPALLLGLIDSLLLSCAWYASLASVGSVLRYPSSAELLNQGALTAIYVGLTLFTIIAVGVYGPRALHSMSFACARLMVAFALSAAGLMLTSIPFDAGHALRLTVVSAGGLAFAAMVLARLSFAALVGPSAWRRRIIVLGAGSRAQRLAILSAEPGCGFVVTRFIAMGDRPPVIAHAVARDSIGNLAHYVAKARVDHVVLALEDRRNALPLADLLRIKTTGVAVNEFSSFLERETGRVDLDSVDPSWLIFSDGFNAGKALSAAMKRLFDIVASGILLLITLPLIALFALAIRLDGGGPVFFRQQRVGLYGEPFFLIKLRSMVADAESSGAVWAQENDPRITRIGRVIRQLRIDELPQLWTVLKGRMSFVGPRPEVPVFVSHLEGVLPYYAERHMVKPGITGWAQVNYPYGASVGDARAKLEYDLYYAKNYSVFLDVVILLQTLRVILWREGAR